MKIEGVTAVHDFHCWSLSRGKYSLSCHIIVEGVDPMETLQKATKMIADDYLIDHTTIQMEDKACGHEC